MGPLACPPLELFLDGMGRRAVPLASLRAVLEWQLQADPEGASVEALLTAVSEAEEAPLPGHTPARADGLRTVPEGIPGLQLAQPVVGPGGQLLHPGE